MSMSLSDLVKRAEMCDELATALATVLDNVDYTIGCCGIAAPVAAALPVEVIERARAALVKVRS